MYNINETKIMVNSIKKDFNKLGKALLKNIIMLNVIVFIEIIFFSIITQDTSSDITKNGNLSGTISILATIIAFYPVLMYMKKDFFLDDLKSDNKKFTLKIVIVAAIVLLSINNILIGFSDILEICLNSVGFSANNALKQLEILNDYTIPMTIDICIIGPILEELIYRGAVLKSLEKYGKRFAILISAILFGLMHGNFYQIFMAMGVGIILGYLATEYSIKLTILLHIINNIIAQISSLFFSNVSSNTENIINNAILVISFIVLVIAFINQRNHIKTWLQNNKMEKGIMLKFFTSKLIVIILIINILSVISGIGKI